MKIADYVSKYLKESYDEPKGIENEEDAKKAIEDLKDFFEMGEDEDNEFGDDLDKMLMAMNVGEDEPITDDELDMMFDSNDQEESYDQEEGKDSLGDCKKCKEKREDCKCEEEEDLEERPNREKENDRNFPESVRPRRNSMSEMEKKLESYRANKKMGEDIEMYSDEPGAKTSVGKGEKKRGFGKK